MKKRKIKKSIKIIFFLLLLLLVGVVSYFCFLYFFKEEKGIEKMTAKSEKVSYGIFDSSFIKAKELVSSMTMEEKVGQLFLVRYYYERINEYKDYYPGGYILFAKDFQYHNKNSIRDELKRVQELHKYPVVLGVDEEGGYVTRVSRFNQFRYDSFESPRYYYDHGGYEELENREIEKIELLKDIGINLNLAPVADLSTNPNDFIYNRSFGYDKDMTSEFIKKMVNVNNSHQMNSCLKHFPGYGNNVDTHTGVAYDSRSYQNFLENDYKPFIAGINEGVPSILVSHNVVEAIDSSLPASLSKKVNIELRDVLGYTGIIMTDDLAMDAVASYVQDGRAATLAINAGVDMIITSDFITMRNEVLNAIQNGEIKEETLNLAVTRIMAWKYNSGLLSNS